MLLKSREFELTQACFSVVAQRSALRRLLPRRTMLAVRDGSINSSGNGKGLNELEDTVGSSRSSFADLWDSTSVEVRIECVSISHYTRLVLEASRTNIL